MPNSYFQFKQFKINQDQCAMKVCTDSCVMGAYLETGEANTILDIGTGTGLLSLMVAQRSKAHIDAVEIEDKAFNQASENVAQSPWADRISLFHQPIQTFSAPDDQLYDLIISNPPFFSNHVPRKEKTLNIALHSEQMSLEELVRSVVRLLSPNGRLVLLFPPFESDQITTMLALYRLYPIDILQLYEKEGGRLMRLITTYSYQSTDVSTNQLFIRDATRQYSDSFVKLLKPYYLNL